MEVLLDLAVTGSHRGCWSQRGRDRVVWVVPGCGWDSRLGLCVEWVRGPCDQLSLWPLRAAGSRWVLVEWPTHPIRFGVCNRGSAVHLQFGLELAIATCHAEGKWPSRSWGPPPGLLTGHRRRPAGRSRLSEESCRRKNGTWDCGAGAVCRGRADVTARARLDQDGRRHVTKGEARAVSRGGGLRAVFLSVPLFRVWCLCHRHRRAVAAAEGSTRVGRWPPEAFEAEGTWRPGRSGVWVGRGDSGLLSSAGQRLLVPNGCRQVPSLCTGSARGSEGSRLQMAEPDFTWGVGPSVPYPQRVLFGTSES
ncbi:uncharacterized protein LOC111742988 [Pteropus vampyrus]|uniref:Uncharacterized protein LOC111742988 n=1 Tax=Pteropus vampyrus TaxID=132908 RepID=A0A6P6CPA0_PTEVA|nr:uncharacterized protein LOC111742988 [Pteropus vampyrus]